jgi:hypothetical protein
MAQHCKVKYKVITPYTDDTLFEIIEVNGQQYKLTFKFRPCKTVSELFAVYYNGVRFPTFAKFLKTINQ